METPTRTGKEAVATLRQFAETVRVFLESQPSARDLDASAAWLEEMSAHLARWAQMNGLAESVIATLQYGAVKAMPEEDWKRIKNSSTMQAAYVAGMYPNTTAVCREVANIGQALRTASENTRTLLSSYRLEREIDSRHVRQAATT